MHRPDLTMVISTLVTTVLGGIGGAAGFTHTHDWAAAHGQHGWLAWADAVVIEGMAVVAGFEIHRDRAAGRTGRAAALPWLVLVVAFGVQMTAQVARAEPTSAGWLLAAMPALGFLTVVKLVMRRTGHPTTDTDPDRDLVTPPASAPIPALAGPAPVPVGPTLARLPRAIRDTVTGLAHQAHADGQQITADDVRQTITLPDPMLSQLVTELNTTINNHPIRTG